MRLYIIIYEFLKHKSLFFRFDRWIDNFWFLTPSQPRRSYQDDFRLEVSQLRQSRAILSLLTNMPNVRGIPSHVCQGGPCFTTCTGNGFLAVTCMGMGKLS